MEGRLIKNYLLLLLLSIAVSCGGPSSSGSPDGVDVLDHVIFVSSVTNSGKFKDDDTSLEGLDAADKLCKDLAKEANLTRDYKAILSDTAKDATSRLFISGAIYTVAGSETTLIAQTATDLWNASAVELKNSIARDETGSFITGSDEVWTGSSSSGTKNTENCLNWKDETSGNSGTVGQLGNVSGFWLDNTTDKLCNTQKRIYCISQ
jgi:hypothetical protein